MDEIKAFDTPESVEAYQALHVMMTPEECMAWIAEQQSLAPGRGRGQAPAQRAQRKI